MIEAKDINFAKSFWDALDDPEYVTEHHDAVYNITTTLLADYLPESPTPYRVLKGGVETDGILMVNRVGVLFLDWKPQSGTDALDLRHGYALAINVEGRLLHVVAASLESELRVWAEPVAVTTCYGNFEQLKTTARIWRAIRIFVEEASRKGLLARLQGTAIPWPLRDLDNVVQPHDSKLFFTLRNSSGEMEAVKFASSYSGENALALKAVKQISVDWWMVSMEYLSRDAGWVSAVDVVEGARKDTNHLAKIKSCIAPAAATGHSKGFVHGDLRLCNVMLRAKTEGGLPEYEGVAPWSGLWHGDQAGARLFIDKLC
ncbi:hypothetical protein SELMODRAFT_413168 [Selaginella moellendorffii]|uniref:Protein kinase domain-containing protein n=1 Tax=Selaginella moellendorffii TaxID=88036 RepID=D8RNK2_SELML|nr:hypothetical protein SELMODRAFT_413168 [Selaginella moellendorffii]